MTVNLDFAHALRKLNTTSIITARERFEIKI